MNDTKIYEIISDNLNIDPNKINRDTNIIEDLHADSLDVVSIITELEDEFNFEFDDSLITQIKTVGDLIDYINSL